MRRNVLSRLRPRSVVTALALLSVLSVAAIATGKDHGEKGGKRIDKLEKRAEKLQKKIDKLEALASAAASGEAAGSASASGSAGLDPEKLLERKKRLEEKLKELRESRKERRQKRAETMKAELGELASKPAARAEQRKHVWRIARLNQALKVAEANEDEALKARISALIAKEDARHTARMAKLKTEVKP